MPEQPSDNSGEHGWFARLMADICDQAIAELGSNLDFVKGAGDPAKAALSDVVKNELSTLFRDRIAVALKEKYPPEMADEIADKVSARITATLRDITSLRGVLRKSKLEIDKPALEKKLEEHHHNISKLSRALGMSREVVSAMIKRYGIEFKRRTGRPETKPASK